MSRGAGPFGVFASAHWLWLRVTQSARATHASDVVGSNCALGRLRRGGDDNGCGESGSNVSGFDSGTRSNVSVAGDIGRRRAESNRGWGCGKGLFSGRMRAMVFWGG